MHEFMKLNRNKLVFPIPSQLSHFTPYLTESRTRTTQFLSLLCFNSHTPICMQERFGDNKTAKSFNTNPLAESMIS
ncbi:hypothetical protein QVD17_36024 [Tagetes erecta]|uniref:Uncharacterized protein n=1 Tax=Tagetes erecta TaxID=13708 RepID=A0AAD8JTM0_TARER|nr:hypothetical protein QVD17_36024 [Tagetes erecta]